MAPSREDSTSPEELALSNMWETATLVELLEKKGLLPKGGWGGPRHL